MASVVLGGASDAELVHCALDGDAASFGVLLGRYRASLYARALGYLGQPEDAADAVQETFLLALTRLGQVRDPEAIGGWLHAVLRSVCAMELRRPARRVTVPGYSRNPGRHHVVMPGGPSGCTLRTARWRAGIPIPISRCSLPTRISRHPGW
jgi:DNA-directed RNA polymerase specialized sigma24 family protein